MLSQDALKRNAKDYLKMFILNLNNMFKNKFVFTFVRTL